VGKSEMVLTLEQAKKVKVQKGYALEPVLPGSLQQDPASVDGKRERKKSSLFGNTRSHPPQNLFPLPST
jgi:hypothetical protein